MTRKGLNYVGFVDVVKFFGMPTLYTSFISIDEDISACNYTKQFFSWDLKNVFLFYDSNNHYFICELGRIIV